MLSFMSFSYSQTWKDSLVFAAVLKNKKINNNKDHYKKTQNIIQSDFTNIFMLSCPFWAACKYRLPSHRALLFFFNARWRGRGRYIYVRASLVVRDLQNLQAFPHSRRRLVCWRHLFKYNITNNRNQLKKSMTN